MREHLRETILASSAELFLSQGFKATSTRQIAQKVGITQPNLYYHFPNKEELYVAVVEHISQQLATELNLLAAKDLPLKEKLVEMASFLQKEYHFDFAQMLKDIHNELPRESMVRLLMVWQESYQAPFIKVLTSGKEPLRQGLNEEVLVTQLFTLLASYTMVRPTGHAKKQVPLEQVIDLFLYGAIKR